MPSVSSSSDHLLSDRLLTFVLCYHGRFPAAILSLVRKAVVSLGESSIEISVQFLERCIDLLQERDVVELLQLDLVETLADLIGLQVHGHRPRMADADAD